jgi:hypothetical protein
MAPTPLIIFYQRSPKKQLFYDQQLAQVAYWLRRFIQTAKTAIFRKLLSTMEDEDTPLISGFRLSVISLWTVHRLVGDNLTGLARGSIV